MNYWRMAMREGNQGPDKFPFCQKEGIAALDYWADDGKRVVGDCRNLTLEQYKEAWKRRRPRFGSARKSLELSR